MDAMGVYAHITDGVHVLSLGKTSIPPEACAEQGAHSQGSSRVSGDSREITKARLWKSICPRCALQDSKSRIPSSGSFSYTLWPVASPTRFLRNRGGLQFSARHRSRGPPRNTVSEAGRQATPQFVGNLSPFTAEEIPQQRRWLCLLS